MHQYIIFVLGKGNILWRRHSSVAENQECYSMDDTMKAKQKALNVHHPASSSDWHWKRVFIVAAGTFGSCILQPSQEAPHYPNGSDFHQVLKIVFGRMGEERKMCRICFFPPSFFNGIIQNKRQINMLSCILKHLWCFVSTCLAKMTSSCNFIGHLTLRCPSIPWILTG